MKEWNEGYGLQPVSDVFLQNSHKILILRARDFWIFRVFARSTKWCFNRSKTVILSVRWALAYRRR
jgi:hypothetical protein